MSNPASNTYMQNKYPDRKLTGASAAPQKAEESPKKKAKAKAKR